MVYETECRKGRRVGLRVGVGVLALFLIR